MSDWTGYQCLTQETRKRRVCQCFLPKLPSPPRMTPGLATSPVQDREVLTAALQQGGAEVPQLASAAVAGGGVGGGDPAGACPLAAAGSTGTHAAVAQLREQLVSPCRILFASSGRESEGSTLLICRLQGGRAPHPVGRRSRQGLHGEKNASLAVARGPPSATSAS